MTPQPTPIVPPWFCEQCHDTLDENWRERDAWSQAVDQAIDDWRDEGIRGGPVGAEPQAEFCTWCPDCAGCGDPLSTHDLNPSQVVMVHHPNGTREMFDPGCFMHTIEWTQHNPEPLWFDRKLMERVWDALARALGLGVDATTRVHP